MTRPDPQTNGYRPTKVAICQNDHPSEGYWFDIRQAFENTLRTAEKDVHITFFDPIELQDYPVLTDNYDLIILSGGNADHHASIPWVLKMREFIKATILNRPQQKIVGICWGHQAIHQALGGEVRLLDAPEVGRQHGRV